MTQNLLEVSANIDLSLWKVLAVIGVGFLAGFINTIAGSGSLLTLPLLMFLGLPANVANGTNRISILFQNVAGVARYRQMKVLESRTGLLLSIPAILGSLLGARIAVSLDDVIMERVIGGLLVVMLLLILLKPNRWLKGHEDQSAANPYWQAIIFFAIGLYGGFIQAGVGFFLLAGLVLGAGYDLVRANALKVFIVLIYTPIALAVFLWHDQVNLLLGFLLAIGSMSGAWIGAGVAVKWGPPFVRWFLLVVLAFASLKLLGVFEIFAG